MLQHVGKHDYIVKTGRLKLLERAGVNGEPLFTRNAGGSFIEFQPLRLETVFAVYLQPASFIASDIEQSPFALWPVE